MKEPGVKWKFNQDFEDIFLDLWYEKDKTSYQIAHKVSDIGSDMIIWLRDHDKPMYTDLYAQALTEMGQVPEPVESEAREPKYARPNYQELLNLQVTDLGEERFYAKAELPELGTKVEGAGKSPKQAVFNMFQEALKHGKFEYPKEYKRKQQDAE